MDREAECPDLEALCTDSFLRSRRYCRDPPSSQPSHLRNPLSGRARRVQATACRDTLVRPGFNSAVAVKRTIDCPEARWSSPFHAEIFMANEWRFLALRVRAMVPTQAAAEAQNESASAW